MELDRDALQKKVHELYAREHAELGESGTLEHLERGEAWQLADTLDSGGVLVFPHAGVHDCGYQIAACVHAALNSGADKIVVLRCCTLSRRRWKRRGSRSRSGQIRRNSSFGAYRDRESTADANGWVITPLISWRHFWQAELRRRGTSADRAPKVYERYPYLAGGAPQNLPGIDELGRLMEEAVVVSTADPFHHGIGYGDAPEQTYDHDEAGLVHAQTVIEAGMRILERGDYRAYNQHCVEAKSDARDTGQVYRYLRGPMKGEVLDISFTDASELYDQPRPTWVAGALIDWKSAD